MDISKITKQLSLYNFSSENKVRNKSRYTLFSIRKAQITIQTFFFILMSIFFVWIIIFGFKQITNINEQISEQEKVLITKDIKKALEYCSDPLNKGTSKSIEISHKEITQICIINKTKVIPLIITDTSKVTPLTLAGDNVILFKNLQPTGSFFIDINIKDSQCWSNIENKGEVIITFDC